MGTVQLHFSFENNRVRPYYMCPLKHIQLEHYVKSLRQENARQDPRTNILVVRALWALKEVGFYSKFSGRQ